LTHLKEKSKIICHRREFKQNKFNPSTAWQLINKLLVIIKPTNNMSMFQPENNTQPGDQHSIRNILNPRFPRAVPNLTSAISYHVAYCTPATPSPEFPVFNPSRNDDMATQISSLKCNKSDI